MIAAPPRSRLLPLAACVLGAAACTAVTAFPGDLIIGTFEFTASLNATRTTCALAHEDLEDIPDGGFSFHATLSRDSVDGGAWLTVDGVSRPAEFSRQTQRYVSVYRAVAPLRSCNEECEVAEMEEALEVVVLSDSQWRRVEGSCERVRDGGLPEGEGLTAPAPTLNGYDAKLACGELVVEFIPGQGCTCTATCEAVYTLEGIRHFE